MCLIMGTHQCAHVNTHRGEMCFWLHEQNSWRGKKGHSFSENYTYFIAELVLTSVKQSVRVSEKHLFTYQKCSCQEWSGICSEGGTLCLALCLILLCMCVCTANASLHVPQLTQREGCSELLWQLWRTQGAKQSKLNLLWPRNVLFQTWVPRAPWQRVKY